MTDKKNYNGLEIAVVGIACRVPGAGNWRDYWKNLIQGIESVDFLTDQELTDLGIGHYHADYDNYVNSRTTIKGKNLFDYSFFGYSPADARLLNPLHRILHQCAWEALEDAGCDPDTHKGLISLYVGSGDDFNWKIYSSLKNKKRGDIDDFTLNLINNKDYLASLISYKLNLKGPSLTVNTACSTSLVAINMACKSLLLGESTTALAGGISIATNQQKGYFHQEGMTLSSDGHCRAFDKYADGIVSSEGAGIVVLKRLASAFRDGDHIYAVIKGSAINNDGNRKLGFTAPSVDGQVECIRKAQIFAGVDPDTINYIEAHGTGTRLGDPIELEALNIAFNRNVEKYCAIGSVKTNIGHLDAAAGVAGLIKTALSLKHRQLPASLHFKEANPEIDFAGGPFYVNTYLKAWEGRNGFPLRAGVSSFGIGGTNAHAILEEAPAVQAGGVGRPYQLLSVSAKTEGSLQRYLVELKTFLREEANVNMGDMSYTLQVGRKAFGFRHSIVYKDKEELIGLLEEAISISPALKHIESHSGIVFMFPGQGSQYAGMGLGLYEHDPVFRLEMDQGFALLDKLTGEDFKQLLCTAKAQDAGLINSTRYAQPLLFLIEYSLSRVMISLGIMPDLMIGHSIGEYTAACISGVFSLEDALRLVVKRGELMSLVGEGAMLSVAISKAQGEAYLSADISLAAVNGPEQIVLSGNRNSIEKLMVLLDEQHIVHVKLHTSHAFHSAMQDIVLEEFRAVLNTLNFGKPQLPFISNLTGVLILEQECMSADYWVRHLRETVNFSGGIQYLLAERPWQAFIEVGAGHSLSSLLKQHRGKADPVCVNLIRPVKDKTDDVPYFLRQLGHLWCGGVVLDWESYYKDEQRRRISLPTYCFEPVSYPAEVDPFGSDLLSGFGLSESVSGSTGLKDWIYYPSWKRAVLGNAVGHGGSKVYLFFSGELSFTEALAAGLSQYGHTVIIVSCGERYQRVSAVEYVLNPLEVSDYSKLIRDLETTRTTVTNIVYGWGMQVPSGGLTLSSDQRSLHLVYFGLVLFIQALSIKGGLAGKTVSVLTNSLYEVIGTEAVHYSQSLGLGLVNVLPQETGVSCVHVDVELESLGLDGMQKLVAELACNSGEQGRIVAHRHGQRWVQDYQQNREELEYGKSAVKESGVYLITGGLGNVGFVLAAYLIEHYHAKLILTGRRELIADESEGSAADWMERYRRLKAMSSEVSYFSVDVSKEKAFSDMVKAAEQSVGMIDGVIHAAGNIDHQYFELIEDITIHKAMAMFSPKVAGIENLYRVFKDRDLDFVWLTSSLSTVLGGLGFASYIAANSYMDHFVAAKSKELPRWKAVGLAGMAFTEQDIKNEKTQNRFLLTPQEVAGLFEWSLVATDNPILAESTVDLPKRILEVYSKKKIISNGFSLKNINKAKRPALSAIYAAPFTETEIALNVIFEEFFGMSGIGINDDFFELGGDSLKGMMMLKRIKKEFCVNVPLKDFFRKKNIREVANYINEIRFLFEDTTVTTDKTIII